MLFCQNVFRAIDGFLRVLESSETIASAQFSELGICWGCCGFPVFLSSALHQCRAQAAPHFEPCSLVAKHCCWIYSGMSRCLKFALSFLEHLFCCYLREFAMWHVAFRKKWLMHSFVVNRQGDWIPSYCFGWLSLKNVIERPELWNLFRSWTQNAWVAWLSIIWLKPIAWQVV